MAQPYFANLINTGKHSISLQDGHGDSINVPPTDHGREVKVAYKFLTWSHVPPQIKIRSYEDRLGNKVVATAINAAPENTNINSNNLNSVAIASNNLTDPEEN